MSGAQTLTAFISECNDLKHSIHSRELRVHAESLDFRGIIQWINTEQPWYNNGTWYFRENSDGYGQGHRLKVKNKVMETLVFQETAQDAIGNVE